jgi:hypothetical protein
VTVSCIYDATLSRVRVSATGLGDAQSALFERSTNQITWATVRGGADVPVSAGTTQLDDWEFVPGVVNYYRVTYSDEVTFRAAGTAAHAANSSVAPGLPTGHAQGDLLVCWACCRDASLGVPATPAGYEVFGITDQGRLFGKIHGASESAPTVTFIGTGGSTMSVSAQMAAFTKVQAVTGAAAGVANVSAQNIATPAATVEADCSLIVYAGWKQDDWTSSAPPAGTTEIGDTFTTLGDDQGITWSYVVQNAKANVSASSFTIAGGTSAISRSMVIEFLAATTSQTGNITPTLDQVWVKNLARPFLNRAVVVTDWSDVEQASRNGVFDIVGRSMPVAVTDVRTSRRYALTVMTDTNDDAEDLRLCLAGGDPVLVHVPADCDVPGMYAVVGDLSIDRRSPRAVRRFLTLPLVECAAPGLDIVGATATYQTVLNNYTDYSGVLGDFTTYQDVLDLIAEPAEVIVE